MFGPSRRAFGAWAVAGTFCAILCGIAPHPAVADDKSLVQALRAGGLVIVVRHGATDDRAEAEPVDFDNIAAQRNLNEKGKAAAVTFGEALRQIGAPIGKVYTSRYHRAYETAVLAGFEQIEKTPDLTYSAGSGMALDADAGRNAAFRKLLGTAPQPDTNTILVTHKPSIVGALGNDWDNVKEGEASIFRPAGGSYTLVARVQMDEWPRIAPAK